MKSDQRVEHLGVVLDRAGGNARALAYGVTALLAALVRR